MAKKLQLAFIDKNIDTSIDMIYEMLDGKATIITIRQRDIRDTTLEVERNGELIGFIRGDTIIKAMVAQMLVDGFDCATE